MKSKIENRKSKIYLTGFMACGKSSVGPILAEQLGWEFLDLDDYIEKQAEQSVSAIFEAEGEEAFRRQEDEALRAMADYEHTVIALGGGTLTKAPNLKWALADGCVVYLKVSVEGLVRRLRTEDGTRPLLLDDTGTPLAEEGMYERIYALLEERRPFYEQAHVTVDADTYGVSRTADAVLKAVRENQGHKNSRQPIDS